MTSSDPSAAKSDDAVDADAPETNDLNDSPGRMIRFARERAQLSVEELAAQTKLTRQVLDALEQDDFERVKEPVYVRGYYRKCAKVLGLPADELVQAYNAKSHAGAPRKPGKLLLAKDSSPFADNTRRRGFGWWLLIIIIAIIVALAWYANGYRIQHDQAANSRVGVQTVSPSARVSSNNSANDANVAMNSAPGHGDEQDNGQASAQAAPAADSSAGASPGASRGGVELVSAAAHSTADGTAQKKTLKSAEATAAPNSTQSNASAAAVGTALTLDVSAASWVRVKDASGKVLFSGLIESGQTQTLVGQPPYAVVLGNARGVKLQYQGKVVSVAGLIQADSTARFSVPLSH